MEGYHCLKVMWNSSFQVTKVAPECKFINSLVVFDVHGSIQLGNVYIQLKVQLDVHVFIHILYSSLFLALHVLGAISTHPQEHKLQCIAIGVCNGYGMLIHWSRYWLGHPHTFITVLKV
jgi:hypothetical protein